MDGSSDNNACKYPVMHGANKQKPTGSSANQHWWLNQLNLKILHQNSSTFDSMGEELNYAKEIESLDLSVVI